MTDDPNRADDPKRDDPKRDDPKRLAVSVLAGEAVLGSASAEERAMVAQRFEDDPDFTAEVTAWEQRLAPLATLVPDQTPSDALWGRIAAQTLDIKTIEPMTADPATNGAADFSAGPAVVVSLEEAVAARMRLFESRLNRWRFATVAAGAIAACLAGLLVFSPRSLPQAPAGQRFVGVVNASGELPPLVVNVDLARGEFTLAPLAMAPQSGKSYQLWGIAPNAKPVSLGLVGDASGNHPIAPLPATSWRDPNLLLAVSLEPQGGSPTGQPTGPVVYKGKLVAAE